MVQNICHCVQSACEFTTPLISILVYSCCLFLSGDFQVVLKNILLSMTDGVIELQVFPNGLFSLCSYIYTQPTRIHFVIGWTELKDFQCLTQQYVVVLFELIL